jgi:hypothetical protein
MLELLKFELKFVEDGGYGRSPRTPWPPPYILGDPRAVRTWAIRRGPIHATNVD